MNQHNGSRLAFSLLSSSSSPSPSSASSFASPLTPNPTPSPAPSPFDQFPSLFPLKLQAQQRQALCRTINLHNSPLSPQESSTISFSDSSSFPYQRVDPNRFLKSEPCVQSQAPCKASTTPNNKARVFTNIIIINNNNYINDNNTDVCGLSDLPIVRGPAAFQTPTPNPSCNNLHHHLQEMDGDPCPKGESKRLKRTLEDLERELLGDDCDMATITTATTATTTPTLEVEFTTIIPSESAERDWTDVIEDLLSAESCSLPTHTVDQSTITSPSSIRDPSHAKGGLRPRVSLSVPPDASAQPRELLLSCAKAIDDEDLTLATNIMTSLEQSVSTYGDPMQRLAAYMADGLAARIQFLKEGHAQMPLKFKETSPADILKATYVLNPCCPYFRFGYMVSSGVIAETFRSEPKVHIIDFDIGHGNQWQVLINIFAQRPGGPPHVRLTGVTDLKSVASLEGVGKKLQEIAHRARVPFEFKGVQMEVAQVEPWRLERMQEEALAVNFTFQLHHMPDESVSTSNPRDRLLRMVRAMDPKVVTLVEHEANTNTSPFYPRFVETLNYFSAIFESLDGGMLARDSKERVNVEQHCLARDIVNIIACEGADRVERYEVAGKWKLRMTMAGFRPLPLKSLFISRTIRELLQHYSPNFKAREECGALYLDWHERGLVAASAWQ